ncbi:MAG: hypothetical protein QW346_02540 [Candidatus Micrarchaeaceae archaeon]
MEVRATPHKKLQSAMEYLMTYGWAILVIAVVLGVIFALGLFSPSTFAGTECLLPAGFGCTNIQLSSAGVMTITIVQSMNIPLNVTAVGCNTQQTTADMQPPYSPTSNQVRMQSGKSYTFNIQCYSGGATYAQPIGSLFEGYIAINYTDDVSGISSTIYGKAITKVSSSPTTSSTITTSTSSTTTSSTSTTTSSVSTTSSTSTSTSSTSTTTSIQYIYCVGSGAPLSNQVYYASVSSTGVGTWTATTSYPVEAPTGCSIYNGYIYCVGAGLTYPYNQTYYAPISSTGVGTWTATTSYPVRMLDAGCSIYNGYIYCVGGPYAIVNGQVYYAPVSSTGIGTWTATTSYPLNIIYAGCSISNGYIYCVGTGGETFGCNPSGSRCGNFRDYSAVYYAPVSSTGIGTWKATASYPVPMTDAGCSIYNGYIYCVGTTAAECSMYNNGYIYCVGTEADNQTYYAPVSSTGIGTWTATTSYPVPMYSAGCSISNGYIYCVGTAGATPYNYVYYAPVSSTGIGTWTATTSYPVPMYYDEYCEIPGSGGGYLGGGGPN